MNISNISNISNICNFCSKEFTNKVTLTRHQKTTKSCLELQGKNENNIECENCKKLLAIRSYKHHKENCDIIFKNSKKEKEDKMLLEKLQDKNKLLEKQNKKLKIDLEDCREKTKTEITQFKTTILLLEKQNEKLQTINTNVMMKLAEKTSTVNNTNNHTVVINTNQLTNEVLRQCANTFQMDHATGINGITKHLTSSLEEHITCTDPSRNIFKYTNEKDEEIIDQNLEFLLPQYLTAVKDRNDFLYKEVFEYFKKNNVSLNIQTDYRIFYNALNSIIEKNGQQNKYTEKCKQQMVKECKRRFLEKNKNKEKTITRVLTVDDVMMNVIETGGTVHDFVDRFFRDYNIDDETDDEFTYRREMEDLFREKKREYKLDKFLC